jgi:phosphate starvation-inducible protein PhoH and related proteins
MKRITVPEEGVETLFGSYDENLKHLEALFNVKIRTQGHDLLIEGDPAGVERAERVVAQLSSLLRDGLKLSQGDVKTASDMAAQDPTVDLRDHFLKGSLTAAGKRRIAPKTVNQRKYLDAIENHDIVFGVGPAGTGKTYLAMAQAVSFLVAKKVSRIILARPAVEAGEKLGFLPGDLQEKVNPYLRPLYDALYDMLDTERVMRYIERGTIEIAPIAFMRGRTLNDAFVILDEAQNTTTEQMKMFLTRLGFGAKAVITGDITQIDLPIGRTSGLVEAMKVVGGIEGIEFVYFDDRDVVRHKLVQQIVKAYESYSGGTGIVAGTRGATIGTRGGLCRARQRRPRPRVESPLQTQGLRDRRAELSVGELTTTRDVRDTERPRHQPLPGRHRDRQRRRRAAGGGGRSRRWH